MGRYINISIHQRSILVSAGSESNLVKAVQKAISDGAATTIRFGQIDGAGIVFYPRYFEMLARYFPDNDLFANACSIETIFRRPNRLGDEITLRLSVSGDRDSWTFSGDFEESEHFRMTGQAEFDDAHSGQCNKNGFVAAQLQIGKWACDASGNLSMSRYFEILSDAVERWFESELAVPFQDLHFTRRLGIPTVKFMTDLASLPAQSDEVEFLVDVTAVGKKSLRLNHELRRGGDCLLNTRQTIVFVAFEDAGYRSIEIPADIRATAAALLRDL